MISLLRSRRPFGRRSPAQTVHSARWAANRRARLKPGMLLLPTSAPVGDAPVALGVPAGRGRDGKTRGRRDAVASEGAAASLVSGGG